MSEANRTDLSLTQEATLGVTPSNAEYVLIPYTAAPDFSFTPSTAQSEQIRSDRQIDDLALVSIEAGGSIDFEMQAYSFRKLIEGVLFNDENLLDSSSIGSIESGSLDFPDISDIPSSFQEGGLLLFEDAGVNSGVHKIDDVVAEQVESSTLVAGAVGVNYGVYLIGCHLLENQIVDNSANKTLTISNAGAVNSLTAKTLNTGDWISINPLGSYRIISKALVGNNMVLSYDLKVPKSDFSTSLPAGDAEIYFSDTVSNGVNRKSYSILQRFQSLPAGENQVIYSGCVADALNLTLETQAIITGRFTLLGLNTKFLSTPIPSNLVVQGQVEKILNSSSNIGSIFLGDSVVDGPNFVQSASIDINNNSRRQNAIGSIGAVGVAAGTCVVTGSLSTYFGDTSLAKSVINNEEKSFLANIQSGSRAVIIDMPKIKFSAGSVGIAGQNEDLILPLEYQALRHESLNYQIKFSTFKYV